MLTKAEREKWLTWYMMRVAGLLGEMARVAVLHATAGHQWYQTEAERLRYAPARRMLQFKRN